MSLNPVDADAIKAIGGLSTAACRNPVINEFNRARWPCGLMASWEFLAAVTAEGIAVMGSVHVEHHAAGHVPTRPGPYGMACGISFEGEGTRLPVEGGGAACPDGRSVPGQPMKIWARCGCGDPAARKHWSQGPEDPA